MIVLKNVSKSFGKSKVLTGISFRIDPGEFICITGPSGAGKSTILSLLVGADDVTAGSVEVDGLDLRKVPPPAMQLYRRRVGFVFQDYKLLANRTVEENVAFPLEVCGAPDALIRKRVPEVLGDVGLGDKKNFLPRQLSGGEKARAAIARAIVHRPLIVLVDEPTGNLDPAQAQSILELLKRIHGEKTTVILATHDAAIVDALQTRVIRLEQGKIIRDGVGGYEHVKRGKGQTVSTIEKGEHRIFSGFSEESVPAAPSGRKIKITQINSSAE